MIRLDPVFDGLLLELWASRVIHASRRLSPTPRGYVCSSGMVGDATRFFSISDPAYRAELRYLRPQRGIPSCELWLNGTLIPWSRLAQDELVRAKLDLLFSPILAATQGDAAKIDAAIAAFLARD